MSQSPKLIFKAIAYNGAPICSNMLYEFGIGEQITIGRSSTNNLVLDDPSRLVSRVQAQLSYRDTSSALINNISNSTGIFVGVTALPPGSSAVVNLSDMVMIGSYALKLETVNAAINQPIIEPASNAAGFSEAVSTIPDDFDFFSVDDAPAEKYISNIASDGLECAEDSNLLLDNLDPLNSNSHSLNQQEECLSDKLLRQQSSDPLALLSTESVINSAGSYSLNESDEIKSLFITPRAIHQAASPPHPVTALEPELNIMAPTKNRAIKQASAANSVAAVSGSSSLSDVHRQALARGLQIDHNKLPECTPAFFEMLGKVLLHLTAGAVNMMHERAHIKHEMRADVTIIASSGNNPLKFAPDAQSALVHLIGERVPGFMHSVEAIDDAFDDLLAHQIGMMSGARAAVYDVVKDFSPEKIQRYMINKNFIDSFLPMSKKSKLWELYETHYKDVAGNAKDDFESRFQQAFSQAYEQEIDRMCEARERA